VIALSALLAAPTVRPAPSGEMLRNPAFELDRNEDGRPDGWQFLVQKGKPVAVYDATVAGKRAAAVRSPGPDHVGYWSQLLTLEPWMKRFRLSVSTRTTGQARGSVSYSAYATATRKWLTADYKLVVSQGQEEWRPGTAEFSVPETAGSVRIALWANMGSGGPGEAWFDDVRLTCLDPPPERPEGNLLVNGDFETDEDADSAPDGWDLTGFRGRKGAPALDGTPKSGRRCAGIRVDENGGGLYWRWLELPGAWSLYRIAAWVRTEGDAAAALSLTAYDAGGKKWLDAAYGLGVTAGARAWQRRVGYFRAPAGAGKLKVVLWANYQAVGAGTVWFDDVEVTAVDGIPCTPYVPEQPAPQLSAPDRRRGFAVFARNCLDLMPPTYVPSAAELNAELELAECPGEYEPLSIGVHAPERDVEVTLTLGALRSESGRDLDASHVKMGVVRCLVKRSHYAMNDRVLVPVYVEAANQVRCPAGQVRQFWLTFQIPPDAQAGVYRGELSFGAPDAEPLAVPVSLRVHPFALNAPEGMALGMYDGHQRVVPGDDPLAAKYADMRAHGMTTVGFCSGLGVPMRLENGEAQISWDGTSGFERALTAYARAGFSQPIVWLMAGDVGAFAEKAGPVESPEYARAYGSVIRAVVERGKRENWPEIVFQPRDEVFAHEQRFERGFRELKLLKECGVRTEMDGTNVGLERPRQTYPYTDVLVHAYGPLLYGKKVYPRAEWLATVDQIHRDGKQIWYYNFDTTGYHVETMRFAYGLYLLATSADGLMSWAYSWADEDPYDDYSGPRGDTVFYYPRFDDRTGGPALGWEGAREGVEDLRYGLTLRDLIKRARASGDAASKRQADRAEGVLQTWLDRVDVSRLRTNRSMQGNWTRKTVDDEGLEAVSGSFKVDVGIDFDDYRRFRREMAELISALLPGSRP